MPVEGVSVVTRNFTAAALAEWCLVRGLAILAPVVAAYHGAQLGYAIAHVDPDHISMPWTLVTTCWCSGAAWLVITSICRALVINTARRLVK